MRPHRRTSKSRRPGRPGRLGAGVADEDGQAQDADGEQRPMIPRILPALVPALLRRCTAYQSSAMTPNAAATGTRRSPPPARSRGSPTCLPAVRPTVRRPTSHRLRRAPEGDQGSESLAPRRANHAGEQPDRAQWQKDDDRVHDERVNRQSGDRVEQRVHVGNAKTTYLWAWRGLRPMDTLPVEVLTHSRNLVSEVGHGSPTSPSCFARRGCG